LPNRLLKEGIVDSDRIDRLGSEAEVLYYRLLVVADDLGRMDARTAIVRARCFPLKESLSAEKISKWLESIWEAGLCARYEVDGKPYIQLLNWDQRVRSSGKYPPPPDGQLSVNCPTDVALGKGKGKGLGATNANDVRFDAATGAWSVPDLLRGQWASAYQALDVDAELAKAGAWLISNPKNQKHNYARFLTNWMQRSQDRAPRAGGGQAASSRSQLAGAV
jgi:hypothetical protein